MDKALEEFRATEETRPPDGPVTARFAASVRTQIFLNAIMWTAVGLVLLGVGVRWTWTRGTDLLIALLPLALAVGYLKARLVLGKVTRKAVDRLVDRGQGRCVFGFLAPRTWILIALMMAMGRALRRSPLPRPIVGLIYAGIGFALLWGSRNLWQSWRANGAAA